MDDLQVRHALAERIVSAGLAPPGGVAGCSLVHVRKVERYARVRLPGTYRVFLLPMRPSAGDFRRGSDIHQPPMLGMNEGAQEFLDVCEPPLKLPDDSFVFVFLQGDQFGSFHFARAIDDREIYRVEEGEPSGQPLGQTFSAGRILHRYFGAGIG
jgi:hypothetical protein